ncbi:MAG: AsmA family protein, partial [Shewanella sp.]
RIDIQDISITNVQIHRQDALLGQSQTLALERFTLHGFSLGTFASFTFKGQYLTSDMNLRSVGAGELNVSRDLALVVVDNLTMTTAVAADILQANPLTSVIKLTSQIALDKKQLSAEISQLSVGDLQAAGTLTLNYAPPVPKFTVVMQTDELLLDKLLPSAASAEEGASTELSGPAPKEPDLSGLARFDLQLTLAATAVKYAKLAMQNLQLQLNVEHGVLDISSLTADLYQGRLLAKARVDGRRSPATYQFDKQITDVQLHPLLKDAADVDGLAGTATFHLKGSGSSLVMQHVKPHLVANGQLEIRDGVLYGVDLAHMLRQAYATVTGAAPAPKGQAKTDFSRLSGTFFLDNGILTNPDLVVVSPLIQLTGKGTANILNDKLDYKLAASLINVLNNQSAAQPKPAGVTIPLMITGTLQHPEYKLDTKALFNQQLQQETNKVKDKLKDSLLKKLGGF